MENSYYITERQMGKLDELTDALFAKGEAIKAQELADITADVRHQKLND